MNTAIVALLCIAYVVVGSKGVRCSQATADAGMENWVSKYFQDLDAEAVLTVTGGQLVPSCKEGFLFTDNSEPHGNCFRHGTHGDVVYRRDVYKIIAGIYCERDSFDFSKYSSKAAKCSQEKADQYMGYWVSSHGQELDPEAQVTVSDGKIIASCANGYTYVDESIEHGNCFTHSTYGSIIRVSDMYKIIDGIRCDQDEEIDMDLDGSTTAATNTDLNENIPAFQQSLLDGHKCSEQPTQPAFYSSGFHIVGGKESLAHSWPWQIRLIVDYDDRGKVPCGGTLISDQYVLSAAHCIANPREGFKVTLDATQVFIGVGAHKDPSTEELTEENGFIQVTDLRANPTFPTQAPNNDVAVFKLSKPIVFDENIQPSCIATKEMAAGNQCVATGWGGTNYATMPQSAYLQQIKGTVLQDPECTGTMAGGFNYNGKTMVCMQFIKGANQTAAGTAGGDSGGPINCKRGDRYYSAGSLSGGGPGSAMYTEFADHLEFIEKSIKEMSA